MEGPYRDLGNGFARLAGTEGARRAPGRLRSVEDALLELLRNSRDAGATNVYIASSLSSRRYRTLVVIDDGRGIPASHKDLVFEPGVTTRHLQPVDDGQGSPHGAGLSLHHIKNAALSVEVLSTSSPTSIKTVFDTRTLPEKSLQSDSRPSNTNLPATLTNFATRNPSLRLYHASPARLLARLIKNRIIHNDYSNWGSKRGEAWRIREEARLLGVPVSLRTIQRVMAGEVPAAAEVSGGEGGAGRSEWAGARRGARRGARQDGLAGPILALGEEDLDQIRAVLLAAARSSYLDLAALEVERRPGEVVLRARVYEPEEEYE